MQSVQYIITSDAEKVYWHKQGVEKIKEQPQVCYNHIQILLLFIVAVIWKTFYQIGVTRVRHSCRWFRSINGMRSTMAHGVSRGHDTDGVWNLSRDRDSCPLAEIFGRSGKRESDKVQRVNESSHLGSCRRGRNDRRVRPRSPALQRY